MTPAEAAHKLDALVREVANRSKGDILAGMPPIRRAEARLAWGPAMKDGVPALDRIEVEAGIALYQEYLRPAIGPFVAAFAANLDAADPRWGPVREVLEMLETPASALHPAVLATLRGDPMPAGESGDEDA